MSRAATSVPQQAATATIAASTIRERNAVLPTSTYPSCAAPNECVTEVRTRFLAIGARSSEPPALLLHNSLSRRLERVFTAGSEAPRAKGGERVRQTRFFSPACVMISDWKEDYNHRRPHSALG
jgi:transposase InsO family protein